MQRILRTLLCLLALLAATALVACGGDKVSESTDVDKLLDDTFSSDKKIDSGKLELAVKLDVQGSGAVQGPVNIRLAGPFQSQGAKKIPKFDIEVAFEGAGQSLKAGVMTTGEKGYVNFNGTDYVASDATFKQIKDAFDQAAAQGEDKQADCSLTKLGIDPRRWLSNAKNAGEEKVGDTETVRITGDVDVAKLVDDVNVVLQKAGSCGLQGQAQLPTKLTDEQKQQIQKAVKGLKVDIYTGKEDTTLRRMHIVFDATDPTGQDQGSAKVDIDYKLLDLNEDQEFTEPENAKPLDELLQSLGGLGLGGLGGLGNGGGSGGSGGAAGGGSGGNSSENLEAYTKCIEDAGNDLEKAQKCAELLNP